ncbi:hypothetical protein, partial [Geminocystis sp. GBBB08]|uniref:hypothetical protein n=1 Tax=Geminocystis sp. GBBB08 TaxID=2604140 RepID=UPI0027E2EC32
MTKNAIGNNIDFEILKITLTEVINDKLTFDFPLKIECFKEENYLVILISDIQEDTVIEIINLIQGVINKYQIIDDFLVRSLNDVNKIYFTSNLTQNKIINESEPFLNKPKKYNISNFSASFILFIFGILSLGVVGGVYYFTRPCVLGNCELITTTKNSVSSLLKSQSKEDLTDRQIQEIQLGFIEAINELKRIPFWSKYHENATLLIKDYQTKLTQLDNLLLALKSVNTAQTVSKNLPLSVDEWNRIKGFFQEAIAIFNNLNIEELNSLKQDKLVSYNQEIKVIETRISQEKQADELLNKGKLMATEIQNKQTQVSDLTGLENLQQSWELTIKTIELIPPETIAYQEKEETLNNYLQQLIFIQNRINQEKIALNIKNIAEQKIKLATESQENNQWTKAVLLWEEAISLFKKISPEVFVK